MSVQPDPKELCYPSKPRADGYCVFTYAAKQRSFLKHNTDKSFVLFCRWRAAVIAGADPDCLADLKRDLHLTDEEDVEAPSQPQSRWKPLALAVAACLLIAVLSSVATYWAVGSDLTPEERVILRAHRDQRDAIVQDVKESTLTYGKVFAAIMDDRYEKLTSEGRFPSHVPDPGLLADGAAKPNAGRTD